MPDVEDKVYAEQNVTAESLATAQQGAAVAACLPALEAIIAKLDRGVENRMAVAVANGQLDEKLSMQLWLEKLAYRKVLTHLQKVVQMGLSVVDK